MTVTTDASMDSKARGKRPRDGEAAVAVAMSVGTALVVTAKKKPQPKTKAAGNAGKPKAKTKVGNGELTKATKRRPKLIWRTRDAENSALYNLQLDISSLQSELQGLQQFRNMLMGRMMNRRDDADGSFVKIVHEYFRVFRNGYEHHPSDGRATPVATLTNQVDAASPDEFVRRVMDEKVMIGRFAGLHQMMKQWERYSAVLGPIQLSFLDSEIITTYRGVGEGHQQTLVTSRAQYHLYISLRTIEIMFPHLLPCHDIVTKILGRRISGVGKFDFVFNNNTSRIVRYEFNLDFMASFVALLGEPGTVARLLEGALISDEFFIGDLSEFVPERGDVEAQGPDQSGKDVDMEAVVRPVEEAKPNSSGSWKMTISSLLTASDEDNDLPEPQSEETPRKEARFQLL